MFLALLGALIIGVNLGLLGSGGSIMTLPILLFILQRPEKEAIAESLAIVGCIALIAAIPYALRYQIHWRSVLLFGLPGMGGAYLGGYASYYISGPLQLTIFSSIMILVSGMMIFGTPSYDQYHPYKQPAWLTILEGFFLGCLTGLIGIGGGFLIIPALVIFGHLSMSFAIGTSLVIIAMNSLIGFIEQLMTLEALHLQVDWKVIYIVSIAGILGSLAGGYLGKWISQVYLRKIFGLNILLMGIYILFANHRILP